MEKLKAKLRRQGGFTLVELLIVVAIIAILVAVSIPMMNSALERSRHAVDQANVRDAIALASMKYLTEPEKTIGETFYYHVNEHHEGYLDTTETGAVTPECKCAAGKTFGLSIKVEAPDAATPDVPKYTVSWKFDSSTGETQENKP